MKSKEEILLAHCSKDGQYYDPKGDIDGYSSSVEDAMDEHTKETVIDILNWVTREESEYAIMYGDQPERFSTFKKDYTSEQLFEIYLESKQIINHGDI